MRDELPTHPEAASCTLLVADRLTTANGRRCQYPRRPSAVSDALLSAVDVASPDAWVVLGAFRGDHRSAEAFEFASGVLVDLDWGDPAVPRDEPAAHSEIPAEHRNRIVAALESYPIPGFAYLTRRGVRVGHVLATNESDPDRYGELAHGAARSALRHLAECGVPMWTDGVPGLRADDSAERPTQPMRLPAPGAGVVLTGVDRAVSPDELLHSAVPRLEVDAALPSDLAAACRAVGAWAQVAVEVVVTALLALASATIGNSRWICVRGRAIPLSLHILTSLYSGSGKGTVRKFMAKAVARIEQQIRERRAHAEQAHKDYEDALDAWKAAHRKGRDAGPRPIPPPLTAAGGPRVTLIVTEANLEGIYATLEDTPRGFVWSTGEAPEVVGMLGRYGDAGARSLDAARLRSLMDSDRIEVHRARSNAHAIRRLPRPWLAIDADVQPGVLRALFTDEDFISGLTARVLAHEPPNFQGSRVYVRPPPEPPPEVLQLLSSLFEHLWNLGLAMDGDLPVYEAMTASPEAERLWAEELERWEARYRTAREEEFGFLGHARGRLLRFAGVLALARDPRTLIVEEIDMRRAIVLMRYFLAHHRRFLAERASKSEAERSEEFRELAQREFEKHPDRGVSPRDLSRANGRRYAGTDGFHRAVADLNAIGWEPRRPASKPTGRKPQVAWFPPGSQRPPAGRKGRSVGLVGRGTEPPTTREASDEGSVGNVGRPGGEHHDGAQGSEAFVGYVGRSPDGSSEPSAAELLQRASEILLDRGEVELPPPGRRIECPVCGSPDGLGVLPDDPTRWYCHSSRHEEPRHGCAIDLHLGMTLGRMPTVAEAVYESRRVVGLPPAGRPTEPTKPRIDGRAERGDPAERPTNPTEPGIEAPNSAAADGEEDAEWTA